MVHSSNGFPQNNIAVHLSVWNDTYIMLSKNAGYKIIGIVLDRHYIF